MSTSSQHRGQPSQQDRGGTTGDSSPGGSSIGATGSRQTGHPNAQVESQIESNEVEVDSTLPQTGQQPDARQQYRSIRYQPGAQRLTWSDDRHKGVAMCSSC